MAQVPYSPVPSVEPTTAATPRGSVEAPLAGFGGAVGAALSNLGRAAEGAGNELFARAIAMQDLQNRQEADRLVSENMIAAAPLIAEYGTLRGEDAVKGLQPHIQALDESRKKVLSKASNPAVARLFDSESRSFLARSIFSSALHSGQELKAGALAASTAEQGLLQNQTFHDPTDEAGFRAAVRKNHETAPARASLMPGGSSPARVALLTQEGDYDLALHRITGMAVANPEEATKLLQQYLEEGLIGGKQAEMAETKVKAYAMSVGTDKVARAVLGQYQLPDGTYSKSFSEMQKEAQDKLAELFPGIPGIRTAGAQAIDRVRYQEKVATNIDHGDIRTQWQGYIQKGATTLGQLPLDLQRRIPPSLADQFNGDVAAHISRENRISSARANEEMLYLYNNDMKKFMETNFDKVPGLSWTDKDRWKKVQRNPGPGGDPRVDAAMHYFNNMHNNDLNDMLGHNHSSQSYKRNLGMFKVATHDAIQAWQEANERPPTQDELEKQIWPSLVMKVTRPGWFGLDSEQEFFRADVLKETKKTLEQEAGKALTDEEARHQYNIQQYNAYFKALKAGKKSE